MGSPKRLVCDDLDHWPMFDRLVARIQPKSRLNIDLGYVLFLEHVGFQVL